MQLGVHLDFQVLEDVPRLVGAAREAGFTAVQICPRGIDVDSRTIHAIRSACETTGVEIIAVASYANPLRPEDASTGFTIGKELLLARSLTRIGTHRLVTRSGTYGATLHDPDPRNQEGDAWKAAVAHTRDLEKVCAATGAQLLLEPHYAHVLSTVEACERFCGEFATERVRLVLDPPNLVSPAQFEKRESIVEDVMKKLGRLTGLVHFKDYRPRPDGTIEYVAAGNGVLDYRRLVTGLIRSGYGGAGIVECAEPATMARIREFLQPLVDVI